jgi:hypothetical protein
VERLLNSLHGDSGASPARLFSNTLRAAVSIASRRVALARFIVLLDLLALFVVALPALIPLTAPGYVHGADYSDPVWRALLLKESLQEGVFFPRWSPDAFYRYGFPVFNFYSPVNIYPVLLVESLASVDTVTATKVAFGANLVLAGIGAYLLSRCVVRHRGAALLAGVLYMYAPFTIGEIYVRSNLAGSAGLALLPFVLVSFVRLCERPSLAWAGACATLLAVTILTHHISSVLAAAMAVTLVAAHFIRRRDRTVPVLAGLAIALALGATSFYWAPVLMEASQYTHTDMLFTGIQDFHLHFVNPLGGVNDELYGRYGYAEYSITRYGPIDLHLAYPYGSPPYKLSLFQGVLLLVSGVALVVRRRRPLYVVSLFLLAVPLLFLTTSWSTVIWETIPIYFIQFPWRLTGPAGLCLAVVGPWAVVSLPRHMPGRQMLLILGMAVVARKEVASPSGHWGKLPLFVMGIAGVASSLWMLPGTLVPFDAGTEITRDTFLRFEGGYRYGTHPGGQFLPMSVQWDNDTMDQTYLPTLYDRAFPPEKWVAETASIPSDSEATIVAARKGGRWMQAMVYAKEATGVAFHVVYYPGWVAYLDGREVPIEPSGWEEFADGPRGKPARASLGVSRVSVPEGVHQITLVFEDTPLRHDLGWLAGLSALGIGATFLGHLWLRQVGITRRKTTAAFVLAVVTGMVAGCLIFQAISMPSGPGRVGTTLVRDLIGEGRRGELQLTAPQGSKPSDYIHVKSFTINGDTRPVLYMHPPSSASTRVWIPAGARLEFAMGLDPEVWDKAGSDVEFEVEVRSGDADELLFSAMINPLANPSQRQWMEASVDLGRFAHQEVELVLRTFPATVSDYDWAGWAAPRIVMPNADFE